MITLPWNRVSKKYIAHISSKFLTEAKCTATPIGWQILEDQLENIFETTYIRILPFPRRRPRHPVPGHKIIIQISTKGRYVMGRHIKGRRDGGHGAKRQKNCASPQA